MSMRPMGCDTGNSLLLLRKLGEFFGEDPVFVPEIIPNSKESSRDELTYIRSHSDFLQSVNYQVIQYEISKGYDDIAAGNLRLMLGKSWIFEYPVSLQNIVDRPSCQGRDRFRPEERAAQYLVDEPEGPVARPEIGSATEHILAESSYFVFLFLLFGHFIILLTMIIPVDRCYNTAR